MSITRGKPYVVIAIWIALLTIAGFWARYFGKLPFGVDDKHLIVHLHAVVFSVWLVILVLQARFAAIGHIDKHMAFGRFAVYWGWLLFIMGCTITLYVFQRELAIGGAAHAGSDIVYPLWDMALFAPVFGLAVAKRFDPPLHKRLMLVAVTLMLVAPVSRLLIALDFWHDWIRYGLWISPLLIAQASDFIRGRGPSRIYIAAMILLPLTAPLREASGKTDAWLSLSNFLAGFFQ